MPSVSLGQTNVLPEKIVPCNGIDCNVCDLVTVAQNILNTAIFISVFLAAFLFAWAGWLYLTSQAGNSIQRAKEVFFNVAVGLVIILAGWLVIDVLMRTLVGTDILPWNKICELFAQTVSLA
jgi:TRAP-type C4-dicarboxylate transport system permease small subunit